MSKITMSRRSFIAGSAAALGAAGLGVSLSGCQAGKTVSGIYAKDFESPGVGILGTGLENTYTANVATSLFTIMNKNGVEMCLTNFGARMVSLMVPDRNKKMKSVVLGFQNIRDYASLSTMPNNFYGAIVGRFGNRIANARFSLNGQTYQCDINEPPNLLHGGLLGWHFQTWEVDSFDKNSHVRFKLVSPDGDMGFPGQVTIYVTYALSENNTVTIFYEAETTKETVLNVSNHNYWDVSGDVNTQVTDDTLFLSSNQFTPVANKELIPTGAIDNVAENGPFDFFRNTNGKKIGEGIDFGIPQMAYGKGYDHNFCILDRATANASGEIFDGNFETHVDGDESLQGQARIHARFHSDVSGITMTIVSNEPGMQFYDGYDLDGTLTNVDGKKITKYGGIALEPQHYPDWPNHSNFPSNYIKPGQKFVTKSEYRFNAN